MEQPNKERLISLVTQTKPNTGACIELEKKELMVFANDSFSWNEKELEKLTDKQLKRLFKDYQHENRPQLANLFGEAAITNPLLRDKFIEPPFSILDTTSGPWLNRKKEWLRTGIKSEVGRGENLTFSGAVAEDMDVYRKAKKIKGKKAGQCMPGQMGELGKDGKDKYGRKPMNGTSIFDPALCEVLYHWFCPEGGTIIDPFAGGSVRGVVANYLGYNYTGIEIRPEQVESNYDQGRKILGNRCPTWICGDSNIELDKLTKGYDMLLSCPPYADLEVYSDLPGDISNLPYKEFLDFYRDIIDKSCALLKKGGFAAWVVGEVRNTKDKEGGYLGFVPDTIAAFRDAGLKYYNEAILRNSIGTATIRANNAMKNKKLVKIHQNVLIFKK